MIQDELRNQSSRHEGLWEHLEDISWVDDEEKTRKRKHRKEEGNGTKGEDTSKIRYKERDRGWYGSIGQRVKE